MSGSLLLTGGRVFDGHAFVGRRDVYVQDGRIGGAPAAGARVIDCSGTTVMPGLVDAHVHLAWAGPSALPATPADSLRRARQNATALLTAGVTTARDTGGPLEVLEQARQEIARGELPGPELLHSGRILCAPGGHGTEIPIPVPIAQECLGPEGFAAGVHQQVEGGASLVKVALNGADGALQLTQAELRAVVDTAHALGVRVACHASVRAAVELAVACGVDTIEHGNGLDAELAREMRGRGTTLVPTVAIFEELQQGAGVLPPEHRCAVDQRVREHGPALGAARAAGVRLALGTDRVPGGEVVAVLDELHALMRHGLSAAQALEAATVGSAGALGLSDRGTLAAGSRADLLVVPGDLSEDLGPFAPAYVVKNGVVLVQPQRASAKRSTQRRTCS